MLNCYQQVVAMLNWFDPVFIFNRDYNYPSIDSLDFSGDQIRIQLDQEKDSVQRRFRRLACQEERQISLRSHERLNNIERCATMTGYMEW
jgi:hypothetical protein